MSATSQRTVDRVRALFEEGATITVVSNTKRPQLDGTTRRITKLGKSFADCDVLTGPGAGKGGFRMPLPTRAGKVRAVSDTGATWEMDAPAEGHTLTIRRGDCGEHAYPDHEPEGLQVWEPKPDDPHEPEGEPRVPVRGGPVCEWFLLCTNPATRTVAHPILGGVPTCDRCAERVAQERRQP